MSDYTPEDRVILRSLPISAHSQYQLGHVYDVWQIGRAMAWKCNGQVTMYWRVVIHETLGRSCQAKDAVY